MFTGCGGHAEREGRDAAAAYHTSVNADEEQMRETAEDGEGGHGTDGVEIETYGLRGVDKEVVVIEDWVEGEMET